MPSSKKPSLTSLTRADIKRLCQKYRNDKPYLRRLLRSIFAKRENIHLFGWFINSHYVQLETPDFHKEILDDVSDKQKPYVAEAAPRGHAKSTEVSYVFPLWSGCNQQHNFCLQVSDTYAQSVEFVNALKDEFENNVKIRWLYGDLVSDLWRDGEFVLSSGVKYMAVGAGMKVRGLRYRQYRPDLIIVDDLENDEQVNSAEQRKKLKRWFTKALLPALSRDGRCIVIGTILHFDSLLNNIIQHKEMFASWHTRLYTAIFKDKKGKDRALWPEHMSLDYLRSIRDNSKHPKYIGSIAFAQEYQQKPFDEEDAIIQPDWIQWTPSRPAANTIVARAQGVDPAAGERQRNDPTGQVVAELDNMGNVYVFYASDKRLSPQKNADDMRRVYDTYEPTALGIEAGTLELVFRGLLGGMAVVPQKPDKDKVRRLMAVSSFFEGGRIYFVQGGKGIQALYDQLMEFPSGSHDDMVDAMVYAIRMLLVQSKPSDSDVQEAGDYNKVGQDKDTFDDDDDDW